MKIKLRVLFFFAILLSVGVFLFGQQTVRAQEKDKNQDKEQNKTQEVDREHRQKRPHVSICKSGEDDSFHCDAKVLVEPNGSPINSPIPFGYGPAQLRGGYNVASASATSTQTIAIVDAYDNPNAFSDLNFYSKTFGIQQLASCPVSKGTSVSPCFQKVNQNGGTS